ncbi:MAG TPA: ATP-binding protein, partial [Polyangiaceae bacterium]|nr:ATP-binding protein [Polyangiaceae bacterium]
MPHRTEEALVELSPELKVLGLNESAQQLYGLESGAVRGLPLAEVILTDGGPIDWAQHWGKVATGQASEQLMAHRSCSGMRVWVCCRLYATQGGALLRVRRASGREVLEQQPGGFGRAIGEMLAVGGVGLWMDDRITDEFDWSAQARVLHDFAPDTEISPQVLFTQMHPDDRNQAARDIQRGIAEKIPYDGVVRYRHGESGYRHLHVFGGATYDAEGLALFAVGGVRDVSAELALRRRVSELEDQLRAAQRGDVVGRLAGGIAHDFNNILTGILGCCEMLGDRLPQGDTQRDVEQIRAATLRAADLTRQLLAFGRRQALQRRAVAPSAVLRDVTSLLRRTLPENVEIQIDPSECPGRVLVDITQLHQVLTNLVVNAAQAMPDGGKIEIGAAQVSLPESSAAQQRAGEYVRFAIEDSGPGVPVELQSRIFEPFFSTKAPGQGSGLGLSVVQGIVEQHQGQIRLRSAALGGARFEVYLPVTERPLERSTEAPAAPVNLSGAALRVMVVEDEKMVRELT